MGVDKRGINRGHCTTCDCGEFESHGSITCEYCGHPPMQHAQIDTPTEKSTSNSAENFEPEVKRMKGDRVEDEVALSVLSTEQQTHAVSNASPSEALHPGLDITVSDVIEDVNVEKEAEIQDDKAKDAASSVSELNVLQRQANKLQSKEEETAGVTYTVHRKRSKPFASCSACQTEIALAVADRHLSNLKVHRETRVHKVNVSLLLGRATDIPAPILKLHEEIEKEFPCVFILSKGSAQCRDCKTSIAFTSGQTNPLGNIRQHVGGNEHKKNSRKFTSADCKEIRSFFTTTENKGSA